MEGSPAGTAGALAAAADRLDDSFFMLNGDSIFDVDLLDLARRASIAGSLAHLALRRVDDASRSGAVIIDGERIVTFSERGPRGSSLISGGVYVVSKSLLARIDRTPLSIETDIFPALAREGCLTGTIYDGFFLDIGIPASLELAQAAIPAWQHCRMTELGKSNEAERIAS
ncbi:hypothetical protein CCP3SC1_540024 [Gammaproteobacteria bacterium]